MGKFVSRIKRVLQVYLLNRFIPFREVPPESPALSIETTNLCNSKCVFCANPVMRRKKEPLSMEKFKKAVDDLAAAGGTQIDFNVVIGDPLLDKQILERARYVQKFPQFRTNGFVTTLQWLHLHDLNEFFESGFTWISVSTVLSGRAQYENFFGVDLYDQMLKNLVTLLEENNRRNKKLYIGIDIKPTDESAETVMRHPDYQRIKALSGQELDRNLKDRMYFVDDWLGAVKLPSYLKQRPLYPRNGRPCKLLYKGLMLYSNGNIGACSCRDFEAAGELILGNIAKDNLKDVWEGEKLAKVRSDWKDRNIIPEICKTCRHYLV